jgi:uncharacterized phage protein (TIGR02218 family)
MKTANTATNNFLSAARAAKDSTVAFAECYTFTLRTGTVITVTNLDQPVTYNSVVFSSTGVLVSGLRYKASTGLSVDKQQVTIYARPTDLVAGSMFLAALRSGAFDGCSVQRDRVFMSTLGGTVIGGVTLFKGRMVSIDDVGRSSANITVATDLVILENNMPHNTYQPTCVHVLYDSGCTLPKGSFSVSGTALAGSNAETLNMTGITTSHAQGTITVTSGANSGLTATVKSASAGTLKLMYPLPSPIATGDAVTVYFGCDHKFATCLSKFANTANFRGFPYIPPPETAL